MNGSPYDVIGVSRGASEDEIKKQYRKLVKQYHPDLHPGDEEAARRMSEINEAYELIKSGKADDYYNSGTAARSSAPGGSYTQGNTTYYYQYADPEELFRAFFGGGFAQRQSTNAYDRVEEYIRHEQYHYAAGILNNIYAKDAKWYYYAAVCSCGMDNPADGFEYAEKAVSLEPSNEQYRQLYNQLKAMGFKRRSRYVSSYRRHPVLSFVTTLITVSFVMQMIRPLFYLLFGI